MAKRLVRKYYSETGVKEWKRLVRDPYHRLEFDTTMHFLKKHSPAEGLVLDAGGGPGRYTIEMAKLGYDMVLLDLTPELLEIAKKQIKKLKQRAKLLSQNQKQLLRRNFCETKGIGDNSHSVS